MSDYANIQFIAHVLNTLPQAATGAPKANPLYPGLPDPQADIAARCALIGRAITAAQAAAVPAKNTLKIFMIPEFALRGVVGAYDMDSVGFAVDSLKALVNDDKYADWVFVFGTLVGCSQPADEQDPMYEVYNFSLIQRGGAKPSDADSHIVMKAFLSNIDFIKDDTGVPAVPPDPYQIDRQLPLVPANMLLDSHVRYMDAGEPGMGRETQVVNYDGGGIFDCAGVRFAIEICLDHAMARIVSSPEIPGDKRVQIQLVPSCGMSAREPALVDNPNGYAFLCDGAGMGASVVGPLAGPAPTPPALINVSAAKGGAGSVNAAALYVGAPQACVGAGQGVRKQGAGSEGGCLVVYGAVAMPPVETVPGSVVNLTWIKDAYRIDFSLFYDAKGVYTGTSVKVTNPAAGMNNLARLLPTTLMPMAPPLGVDQGGQRGQISFRVGHAGDDYPAGIEVESTLPDFPFSGLAVEFHKQLGKIPPRTIF